MKQYNLIKNTSFISTIFNEEKSISPFLRSFFEQDYLPEEIIIVDGGSKDKTLNILKDFFLNKLSENKNLIVFKEDSEKIKLQNIESGVRIIDIFYVKFNKQKENSDINSDTDININNIDSNNNYDDSSNDINNVINNFKDDFRNNNQIKIKNDNKINKNVNENDSEVKLTIKILQKTNAKISEGRNTAIKNAKNEIICVSDAGCVFDKNWTYEITKYLISNVNIYKDENKLDNKETAKKNNNNISISLDNRLNLIKKNKNHDDLMLFGNYDVVGGFSKPIALTYLEKILSICIMPKLKEINPQKFMPSSRNISFKKIAWEKVGGYPENLDYGEDMRFNFNLKQNGYVIKFNPDAIIFWRMREDIVQIFKQFFRYSKGDAKGKMYFYRHLIRFLSFAIFIVIFLISIFFNLWFLLIYIPLFCYYVYKPYSRINNEFKHHKNKITRFFLKISALFTTPLMLIYIDIAKMAGYIYGFIER